MNRNRITIISMKVNITTMECSLKKIKNWLKEPWAERKGRSVCLSNVHMCMEVHDDSSFKEVVNNADLVLPDGKPLSIAQKILGFKHANQVRGTDITLKLCELSHQQNITLGFYGGSEAVLEKMRHALTKQYPHIKIKFMVSPPFRPLTEDEGSEYIRQINDSRVDILFIGLGCPKQETWMAEHRDQVKCIMLGVGAAFDFIAGNKKHAPKIIQELGLEWGYRLACEPRRLWKRYLKHNPRFIWCFTQQLLGQKF